MCLVHLSHPTSTKSRNFSHDSIPSCHRYHHGDLGSKCLPGPSRPDEIPPQMSRPLSPALSTRWRIAKTSAALRRSSAPRDLDRYTSRRMAGGAGGHYHSGGGVRPPAHWGAESAGRDWRCFLVRCGREGGRKEDEGRGRSRRKGVIRK